MKAGSRFRMPLVLLPWGTVGGMVAGVEVKAEEGPR